ncbi:hypothetical protein quinque_009846 [Culex quinquefasciatus]
MMMENLDHVYCNTASTDVGGKDSSDQMSLFKEVKQLQSILLLHLDLIQEQSDQILAKDKSVAVEKVYEFNSRLIPSIDPAPLREAIPEVTSTVRNIKKENISSEYDHFDSIDFGGELESEIKIENNEIEEEIFLNYSKSDDESVPSSDVPLMESRPVVELRPSSASTPVDFGASISQPLEIPASDSEYNNNVNIQFDAVDDQPDLKDLINLHDGVSKASNYNPICSSGNSSDGSLIKKSCKTLFMITKKPYITCNWKDEAITNDIERILENEAAELEVPCWTVIDDNNDSASNSSELLTENISDEVYMKRHAKFELDERRRKKWDVQRIREQKTIERLKKRHLKTDPDSEQKNIVSFYPLVDSIKYVQVTDEIPVQAFGELIPILPTSSFSLPWMGASLDATDNIPPTEFGPGPLFSAATGVPATATTSAASQPVKTKFLHRLAPNLVTQKQRFTKRIKKET